MVPSVPTGPRAVLSKERLPRVILDVYRVDAHLYESVCHGGAEHVLCHCTLLAKKSFVVLIP
jgi:hypothetical protein